MEEHPVWSTQVMKEHSAVEEHLGKRSSQGSEEHPGDGMEEHQAPRASSLTRGAV